MGGSTSDIARVARLFFCEAWWAKLGHRRSVEGYIVGRDDANTCGNSERV